LYRNKILKNYSADSYSMPSLERLPSPCKGKAGSPAKKDPVDIEREAYEKGYASGEKAGYEMGRQKAALLFNHLENLFQEVSTLKEKMLSELEPQMVLLAVTIARKILKEESATHPEIAAKMIKEAITKISKTGTITIKLNRPLYDLLIEKKEEFQKIFPDLLFELDSDCPTGGAVVRSLSEEVQTDFDFQLSNIIEDLRFRSRDA
jgi:flagellar assembly protein FliH